ncbi:MAG: transporter substrate-binding domain-containing protein [Albidovulum sp.]
MTRISNSAKYMLSVATTIFALPFAASAQEACQSYTVVQGDSLGSIAQAAYGTFDYQMVFNANRNTIGGNPNNLEPGTVLDLPCEDGSLSGASAAQVIEAEEAKQSQRKKSNSFEPPLKLVSGGGWAPFTGEELKGGGMLVRLATTSLNRGGNDRDYSVSFVNDWTSHLDTLLPIGAFDISVAWIIPDCSDLDLLDDNGKFRCTQLDKSLPIYETVTAYWSMPDNKYANVTSFADYAGARICRPEGWSTADITIEGLVEPIVTMVRPATAQECVEMLVEGEADMASLDLETGGATVASVPEAAGIVQPNPSLAKLEELAFVTHKTNPRGRVYLAMLNRGLNEMRESGEWYAVIADSLSEFNKSK